MNESLDHRFIEQTACWLNANFERKLKETKTRLREAITPEYYDQILKGMERGLDEGELPIVLPSLACSMVFDRLKEYLHYRGMVVLVCCSTGNGRPFWTFAPKKHHTGVGLTTCMYIVPKRCLLTMEQHKQIQEDIDNHSITSYQYEW